jgi:hypothetical protein
VLGVFGLVLIEWVAECIKQSFDNYVTIMSHASCKLCLPWDISTEKFGYN